MCDRQCNVDESVGVSPPAEIREFAQQKSGFFRRTRKWEY